MTAKKVACTDPSSHVQGEGDFLRGVARVCTERGLRLTPLRADVLGVVARSDRPIKAYDVLAQIGASKASMAPPTAYRALDFLLEQGFIHRLESIHAYVACHHPGTRHVVPFLICDHCHMAIEIEDESTARMLGKSALALGFTATTQALEVHGLCEQCSKRPQVADR